MSDSKDAYSQASRYYVETTKEQDEALKRQYRHSRERKAKHGRKWRSSPVNLNEICDRFAPGDRGRESGQKYIFEGESHLVIADMASGYLRIRDKQANSYIMLDGAPSDNDDLTHFHIKKREEM